MTALPSLDQSRPILIFKASRRSLHHGSLGIARSLGRLGVPVYAIVEDRCTPLAASRYVTKAFEWKNWPADREVLVQAMSRVAESINRPAILIPLDDLSALFVAENADSLSRWFVMPGLPRDLPRQMADKASFYSLCAKIGVPCARSVVVRCREDVREFVRQTTFPIVAKAVKQWQPLNNRYSVKVIQSSEALFDFCDYEKRDAPPPMILQEYVPGTDWIYHGYCNAKSNLYVGFTGKKLLDYPAGAGSTALGLSINNETLRAQSEELLRTLSYSGITDMDWRQDTRDGQYKIMDCNPRVGMNFRMFENMAGIDVVRAQHLDLTGRGVDNSQMIERRLFIVESYYLLSAVRREPAASATEPDKHLPPESRELAWWSSDDKLPFFVMSVRLIVETAMRALLYTWHDAVRWLLKRRTVRRLV
jgi:D-aspartate ligase